MLQDRVHHPELFYSLEQENRASQIHWRGEKVELSELLVALSFSKLITTSSGTPAPFTEVVRMFEQTLNFKLGDPREVKRLIYKRKRERTPFLECLINTTLKNI